MTLDEFKSHIIRSVKNNYTVNVICAAYPMFKQVNVIRAGGGDLTTMTSFIDGKRADIAAIESVVNALTDQTLLENFTGDTDAAQSDYVASVLTSLTTDEQKLYVACALR